MQPDFVTYKHGQIVEVRCKCCGTPIRKMIPMDELAEVKRINGKPVVFQRLVLACLPNYREMELLTDDGGRHITCACADCANEKEAQAFHDIDMAEQGIKTNRKVVAVTKVSDMAII